MWQLENKTLYPAQRAWLRDPLGAEVWVVVVKATYDIKEDGATVLSGEQKPVCQSARYTGEPGKSSLLYDTDVNLAKKTTDVFIHGHAYAPQGKPVTEMEVGFRVGPVKKSLLVTGSRYWFKFGPFYKLNKPAPFIKMPIVYERAFGGADMNHADPQKQGWERRNPIGTGFALEKKNLVDTRAPNITYRNNKYPGKEIIPAGLGPIPADWMPRLKMAGTHDEKWEKTCCPLRPRDFDERFYQCAPDDQQSPEFLTGGEDAVLINLSPEGVLRFKLPKLRLAFSTQIDNEKVEHRARLHTVIIEPDERRLQMVWHTALERHKDIKRLKKTVVSEKEYVKV